MKKRLAKAISVLSLVSLVSCPGYFGPNPNDLIEIEHHINEAPVFDPIGDSDPGIPAPTL